MKYYKFWCLPDRGLPTTSGVDPEYRLGNYGVWKAEDEFNFPEIALTSGLCSREQLKYAKMSQVEINMYEDYLTTISG